MQRALADSFELLTAPPYIRLPAGLEIDMKALREWGPIEVIESNGFPSWIALAAGITPYHVGGCI